MTKLVKNMNILYYIYERENNYGLLFEAKRLQEKYGFGQSAGGLMEAYKFEAIVQKNGVIQIPELARLANQHVEVFIVIAPIETQETKSSQAIENFLTKWRGVLRDSAVDELKSQYLQEKYS